MQVSDLVLPRLGAPDWTVTLVVIIAILGLPIAFALAWAFDFTSDGIQRTPDSATQPEPLPMRPHRALWFGAGILVALTIGWFAVKEKADSKGTALDSRLIAVLPFRVGGADPSLRYLREGMLDLMAATLVADDGTHAVDPPTVLAHWKQAVATPETDLPIDSARNVARAMRAGHMLVGSIVGTAARLTLNLEVVDVASGTVRRIRADGTADSLPQLVDRVAGEVLGYAAGESGDRASLLAGVPLPAIRAYLTGRTEYRGGDYVEAARLFTEALNIDSTFVLAAMGIYTTSGWVPIDPQLVEKAKRLAWSRKDDMPVAERAVMVAELGPHFPAQSSGAELLAAAREAVRIAPDRPESYNWVGEWLYHRGAALGVKNAEEEAMRMFERVLELDPNLASASGHMLELAYKRGDTATVRRIADEVLARDSTGLVGHSVRFLRAVVAGDKTTRDRIVAEIPRMTAVEQFAIYHHVAGTGDDWPAAERAAEAMASDQQSSWSALYVLQLNRGRPQRAQQVIDKLPANDVASRVGADMLSIAAAILAYGDTVFAAGAVERLRAAVNQSKDLKPNQLASRKCAIANWQIAHGHYEGMSEAARTMRPSGPVDASTAFAHLCADLIVAQLAVHEKRPEAGALLEKVDSISRTMPAGVSPATLHIINMHLARAFQEHGNDKAALDALRRRVFYLHTAHEFLSANMLEQARVANKLGERAAAVAAYSHFLKLMNEPEPALQPVVEAARRELSQLTRDR